MSAEIVHRATDDWIGVLGPIGDLATRIADTDFVPQALRGSKAAVAAAILTGRELGIPPMLSLRHVHVIKGKPGMSAELMRLLVLREGHDIEVVEASNTRAVVRGRRKGSERWSEASFNADQAKLARIDLGGYPEDKLVARATTRLCRRMFADSIGGLPTVDELEDGLEDASPTPAAAIEQPAPARRTAQRRTRGEGVKPTSPAEHAATPVAEAPEPDLDEDETPAAQPVSADEPIDVDVVEDDEPVEKREPASGQQTSKLFALLGDYEIRDRAQRLLTIGQLVGRTLKSFNDLTKVEASRAIEVLVQVGEGPDPAARLVALLAATQDRDPDTGEVVAGGVEFDEAQS